MSADGLNAEHRAGAHDDGEAVPECWYCTRQAEDYATATADRYGRTGLHGPGGWCGETRQHEHGLSEGIITYTDGRDAGGRTLLSECAECRHDLTAHEWGGGECGERQCECATFAVQYQQAAQR